MQKILLYNLNENLKLTNEDLKEVISISLEQLSNLKQKNISPTRDKNGIITEILISLENDSLKHLEEKLIDLKYVALMLANRLENCSYDIV